MSPNKKSILGISNHSKEVMVCDKCGMVVDPLEGEKS